MILLGKGKTGLRLEADVVHKALFAFSRFCGCLWVLHYSWVLYKSGLLESGIHEPLTSGLIRFFQEFYALLYYLNSFLAVQSWSGWLSWLDTCWPVRNSWSYFWTGPDRCMGAETGTQEGTLPWLLWVPVLTKDTAAVHGHRLGWRVVGQKKKYKFKMKWK